MLNEGTGVIAQGIKQILHLQRRSNTAPSLVHIESEVVQTVQPIQRSHLVEAIRDFLADEPMTSDTVKESIIFGLSVMSIGSGARYVTTLQNRRRLARASPVVFGSQPGSAPSSGTSLLLNRDGMIVVIVTSLALYMGCNVVIMAVLLSIWRARRAGNGAQDDLDRKSKPR